jgi:uncharacterized membrane protein
MSAELERKSPLGSAVQAIRVRPRLALSVLFGIVVFLLCPTSWRAATRSLVAWDSASILYLFLFARLAGSAHPDKIRIRAKLQDDGAIVTLILSLAAAAMCFVAIAFELAALKDMTGQIKLLHVFLVSVTMPAAWMFIHSMFALHYAHEFYDSEQPRGHGLDFPGDQLPSYWDFLYFSFIIGTSGQTADVGISSRSMRQTATVHCVFAFFFNIVLLGLTINVASSLL